ncbi:MAG: flagellar basal-body MS-ring/collar protein FliF [Anaeromyxobacter sp.]
MMEFWRRLGRAARIGLVGGVVVICAMTAVLGYWLMRTDYQILFADLSAQDAAAMSEELERLKVPFKVEASGEEGATALLVDRKDVYNTRLKLMGRDLPLHGAVGFELFNNSDFGMTEFAQRINYQRALQGELTRTILSLSEVREARVLLALPEQGLFKASHQKSTASITLTLKQGRALAPAQVAGIQRLVSAAVPGIATQDVTIVDQSGVALTRSAGEGAAEGGGGRLDLKKDTESYLARKVAEILDRTLGAGQALATVDVTLDMDRVQTTTEDVMAPPGAQGRNPTGVVVHERATLRDVGGPVQAAASGEAPSAGSSQREVEYAVGRRVEQVISQPGTIRRIQAVAVVKVPLDPQREEQLRRVVAASIGANLERGDTVVVQSIDALSGPLQPKPEVPVAASWGEPPAKAATEATATVREVPVGPLAVAAGVAGLLALIALAWRMAGRRGDGQGRARKPLTDLERQAALEQVRAWMRGTNSRAQGEWR